MNVQGDVAPTARQRWLCGVLCVAVLAGLPALARRPPVLDLAPQLEQVALVWPTLTGERPELEVAWLAPNRLGYLPLVAGYALGGARAGPRLALALVLAGAVASVHLLAAARGRSVAAALLATTFLLSSPLYAGFFNFLSGLAALAYWGWELAPGRAGRGAAAIALTTFVGATLLATAHLLWLAVGGAWVALVVLARRDPGREILARAAGAAPVVAAALAWHAELLGSGWRSFTQTMVEPLDRVASPAIWPSLLWGGLRGAVEPLLLAAVGLWLAAGALAARRRGGGADRALLAAAAVCFAVAILAPDKVDRAVLFAWRWAPVAGICLVLGVPEPAIGARWRLGLAATALAALIVPTAAAWRAFDRQEMRGFDEVLAAVPEGSAVIGLDFAPKSLRFRVDPYFQMVAYAAVERGARLGSSFTEVGSSLVRLRRAASRQPSLRRLDYAPAALRPDDLLGFDHLFVHGPGAVAASLVAQTGVLALRASAGSWHLLAIAPAATRRGRVAQPEAGESAAPSGGAPAERSPQSAPAARQAPQASSKPG